MKKKQYALTLFNNFCVPNKKVDIVKKNMIIIASKCISMHCKKNSSKKLHIYYLLELSCQKWGTISVKDEVQAV